MADINIDNQKEFYENVRLDDRGRIMVTPVTQQGNLTSPGNAKEFYDNIALDENGKLKIIIL